MENIFTRAARVIKEHRFTRRWKRVISVLAAAVIFCTTYALILPAMTAERQPVCGMEAHTHTEECFENGIQVCGKEEHVHTEECYPKSRGLTVGVIVGGQSGTSGNTPGQAQVGVEDVSQNQKKAEAKTPEQLAADLSALTLSGDWQQDVTSVAKLHTGCEEEDRAFVSAVLEYTGVKGMPRVKTKKGAYTGYVSWVKRIREAGLYEDVSQIPEAGDLVFLDQEENAEKLEHEDERIDHAGIVINVRMREKTSEETGETITTLRDIMVLTDNAEGQIESFFYNMEDAANVKMVAGYAKLPEKPQQIETLSETAESQPEETQPSETAEESQPETAGAAETMTEGQAGETQPAGTGTESQADNGIEAGTETGTESLAEEQTGMVAGTDTGAAAETETGAELSSESETSTELLTDSETETELSTETDTDLSTDEDIESETNMELSSNGDMENETDEDWGWTWEDFLGEDEKESETDGLRNETVPEAGEADTEGLTEEQEADTETVTEMDTEGLTGEPETGTEGLTEEGTETELSLETGAETDTKLSTDGEAGTELPADGDTEAETDEDWGWTWEDFPGEDEEESETDWYDWLFEDETDLEEETAGGDPEAGLETSEEWEASVAGVELTGVWGNDLAAVAETQLGVKEDMENYTLGENGEMKGITRYGQWYGEPYGDWDAMFVSFCLNYAEVPHSSVPRSGSCGSLAEMLQMYDLYEEPLEYEATKGDLVFLDTDEDGIADHAGILAEATESGELQVIAGDIEDEVKSITYAKGDAAVTGYGRLPQKPAQKVHNKVYNDGKVKVTAEYTAEAVIPENAVLVATEVPQDDERYERSFEAIRQLMEEKPERETEKVYMRIYNIGFYVDEQEIKPQAEVKISIEFLDDPGFAAGANKVIHMEDGKEPEALDVTNEGEKVEFSTKTF